MGAAFLTAVRFLASGKATRDCILFVTLDTTRADHIGAYGYRRAQTPHIDRLAAEGARFASVTATAPLTLPAHASLLTGLYPPEHGVRNNGNFRLEERIPTVATVLRGQGYRTAAFVSAFVLDRRFGLARGFERYDDSLTEGTAAEVFSFESQRAGDKTGAAAIRWLEAYAVAPTAPFFVWLHLYDPHEPYTSPRPRPWRRRTPGASSPCSREGQAGPRVVSTPRPSARSSTWAGLPCAASGTTAIPSSMVRGPSFSTSRETLGKRPTFTTRSRVSSRLCAGSSRALPATAGAG